MRTTAAGGRPNAEGFRMTVAAVREAMADGSADTAGSGGGRGAEGGGATDAERAEEAGGVETEELIAVSRRAGRGGGGGGASVEPDGVTVGLEAGEGAGGVVDFEDALDLARRPAAHSPAVPA